MQAYKKGVVVISHNDMNNIYPLGGEYNSYLKHPLSFALSLVEVVKTPSTIMEKAMVLEVDEILEQLTNDSRNPAKFD